MSEEGKFWFRCWALLAGTIATITAILAINSYNNNEAIIALQKTGVSAIQAHCAITRPTQDGWNIICLEAARDR